METTFKVTDGMKCEKCANRLASLLQNIVGVHEAIISFDNATAQIRFNPHAVNLDDVAAVFQKGGFEAHTTGPETLEN